MSSTRLNAVTAALEHLIDDAALFPPARTPMVRAVPAHAVHRSSSHAWMVGRFVCPASRLTELSDCLAPGQRVAVSLVCDGAVGARSFAAGLRVDLARAAQAQSRTVQVEAVEIPLPLDDAVAAIAESVEVVEGSALGDKAEVFCEVPVAGQPPDAVARAVDALAAPRTARSSIDRRPGAKVRCRGPDAQLVPTTEELAAFMVACRDARIRFKATAGLHQPYRHADAQLGVDQHGFLNLLAAAAACVSGAGARTCGQILACAGPHALRLDRDALHAPGGTYTASDVARTRAELFVSFGSCSVDEPIEHLADLGLLTAEGAVA